MTIRSAAALPASSQRLGRALAVIAVGGVLIALLGLLLVRRWKTSTLPQRRALTPV